MIAVACCFFMPHKIVCTVRGVPRLEPKQKKRSNVERQEPCHDAAVPRKLGSFWAVSAFCRGRKVHKW